jgi:hypothetical protein
MSLIENLNLLHERLKYYKETFTNQREGQMLFNTISDIDSELAQELLSSNCDPYYNDSAIDECWSWISLKWK